MEGSTDWSTISCADCGSIQRLPALVGRARTVCHRCRRPLEQTAGRSMEAALACAVSALLLLIPVYFLPLLEIPLGGATQQLYVASSVGAAWRDGQPLLAGLLLVMLMMFPILRMTLLTVVLSALVSGRRLAHAGRLFRWFQELRLWSNLDVFLIAMGAVYLRMNMQLTAEVGMGGWALVAAVAISAIAVGALDPRTVWNAVMPDRKWTDEATRGCKVCELPAISDEGRCARCRQPLVQRQVISRTAALVATGTLLYVPSYLYPMSYDILPMGRSDHTILSGIERFFREGLWGFAALIIVASVLIPAMKLVGLTWCARRARVVRERGRVFRTRVHRCIQEIGRWSMIDPFLAAGTAGFVFLSGVAEVHVGPAATPFALVVVMTLLASRVFDPRLMWQRSS